MRETLNRSQPGRRALVLYGLSGCGKTQLALKYLEQNEDCHTSKIWVNATSVDTAIDSLEEIVFGIGDSTASAYVKSSHATRTRQTNFKILVRLVRSWLEDDKNRNWIMVIDNVESLDQEFHLSEIIPHSNHGSVILISTRSDTPDTVGIGGMEIGQVDTAAGIKILTQRLGDSDGNIQGKSFELLKSNVSTFFYRSWSR